ncbi:MAG: glycosyltransferase family 39 protein [Janthinobacterium lividum]
MADAEAQRTPVLMSKGLWLLLLVLFTILWFAQLDIRHLIPSDEGRYAEMAREMLHTGDWITPRYNGYKYFEKPPLQTWLNALTFAVFGVGDWQARLWTALSGFVTVLMVGATGRRVFNPVTGLLAALALLASPYWNLLGHFNTLDMGLSCMMAITLCALLLAQRPGLASRTVRGWMLVCWASMALAVLSKGLIGLALPGAVLILYTLLARDWALWKRLYLISGIVLFLVIAAPWFLLVQHKNPEFFDFFFINEHVRRFLNPDHHRTGPLYYFVPVVLVGFLPWISLLPGSTLRALRAPRQPNGFSPAILLVTWALLIFVFFSVSESKLVSYVLPIAPAVALLLGLGLTNLGAVQWRRHLAGYAVLLVAGCFGAWFLTRAGDARTPNLLYREYMVWVYVALAILLIGVWLSARVAASRHAAAPQRAVVVFAAAWFLAVSVAGNAHEIFGKQSSGVSLVPAVKAAMATLPPNTPFYSVGVLDHTMPFYLDHTMIMVAHPDELDFGIRVEPQKWLPTFDAWIERWNSDPHALALMPPDIYKRMLARGVPMQLIAADARRVIVEKSGS